MAFEIVVASLGSLHALQAPFADLAAGFPNRQVIVRRPDHDLHGLLVAVLQERSALPVFEPDHKEAIAAGGVHRPWVDYRLSVERGRRILSTERLVYQARPPIDVPYESTAEAENVPPLSDIAPILSGLCPLAPGGCHGAG